jgi:hypothetical protein
MSRSQGNDVLLRMHQFYGEESRHQRSMMWETVKWFTPVLMAIHASWWWWLSTKEIITEKSSALPMEIYLFLLSFGGIALSLICLQLLRSFYRTNIIHITMLAKAEDELDFDERDKEKTRRNAFLNDDGITYENYLRDRKDNATAEAFKDSNLSRGRMYLWMRSVFHLFILASIVEMVHILLSLSFGKSLKSTDEAYTFVLSITVYVFIWYRWIARPAFNRYSD